MNYVLVAFILACCACFVAGGKNRTCVGWFFLTLFCPILLLLLLCLPGVGDTEPATKKCPFCAERIKAEAVVCKHCNRDLPPVGEFIPAAFAPAFDGSRCAICGETYSSANGVMRSSIDKDICSNCYDKTR